MKSYGPRTGGIIKNTERLLTHTSIFDVPRTAQPYVSPPFATAILQSFHHDDLERQQLRGRQQQPEMAQEWLTFNL